MQLPLILKIQAFWQPRFETAEQVAARFEASIDALREVDPLTSHWSHVSGTGACYDLDTYRANIIDMVVGRVARGDFDEPQPEFGYNLIACNAPDVKTRPERLWLRGNVGGTHASDLQIHTSIDTEASPDIITYKIFGGALKAVMAAFEPDWVSARPSDLTGLADERRGGPIQMPISWMIMMTPERAKLITPPPSVIAETSSDGSLFMAATDQTFVTSNPAHMAAARAMEAVVDPLNSIMPFRQWPWQMDSAESE